MRNYLLALWKTFVVTLTGLLFAWLTNHGIKLNDELTTWITIGLVAAGLALYNLLVNWLLAQTGDTWPGYLARLVGKLLSLGGEAPRYPTPPTSNTSNLGDHTITYSR